MRHSSLKFKVRFAFLRLGIHPPFIANFSTLCDEDFQPQATKACADSKVLCSTPPVNID